MHKITPTTLRTTPMFLGSVNRSLRTHAASKAMPTMFTDLEKVEIHWQKIDGEEYDSLAQTATSGFTNGSVHIGLLVIVLALTVIAKNGYFTHF